VNSSLRDARRRLGLGASFATSGRTDQGAITDGVTVGVVQDLEVIEISHDHRHRVPVSSSSVTLCSKERRFNKP